MALPSDTVISFFNLVKTGGPQTIASIQALFVPDQPQPPGPAFIGLTTGNPPIGPQFTGQNGVGDLFQTLQNSFSAYGLDPTPDPGNPQLLMGGNMIAVEAMLDTGSWKHSWVPTTQGKSRPLSYILGTAEGGGGGRPGQLPVCAVFTLDGTSPFLITNLALYFDRWKLSHDKWDQTNPQHIDK